ncbi:hypothetical protein GQX73_g435 [Xylaria multiplex]|uniref:Zn(2)-C6 fungal-type domain-containing protein n=1 Tax=Xylaria multiplex TaxID=323545 RepID=A0A7C8MTA5_9PEZI|nr:hypothetical protein GQX73_g435 [Xylaria multiplex]
MSADAIMPLRQTCDRCRELKVRCKRGSAQAASTDVNVVLSPPCARCFRIGVVCKYSPRHRSGRHAQRGGQDEIEKHAPSDIQRLATPFSFPTDQIMHTQDIDWSWSQEFMPLGCTSEPSGGDTRPAVNMSEYAGEKGNMSISLPDGNECNQVPNDSINVAPANANPTQDSTARESSALDVFDLNTRTFRMLQSMTIGRASDVQYPSNDEMINVASCLLKIIEQLCHQINNTDSGYQGHSPSDSSSPLTQVSLDTGDTGDLGVAQHSAAQSLDLSTAIMTLACHQRIIDLFKSICSRISRRTHNDSTPTGSFSKETDATIQSREVATVCFSNAQRFMTLELLTYLLNKLDRGQAQFINALRMSSSVGSAHSSTSSAKSSDVVTTVSPSIGIGCSLDVENDINACIDPGSASVNVVGHLVMDRAMDSQRALLTQIKRAKQEVQRMDGI